MKKLLLACRLLIGFQCVLNRKTHCSFVKMQDVHNRFRTESHSHATPRFNERFILSIASCETCVVMNDELKTLPISSHMKNITAVPVQEVKFFPDQFGHESYYLLISIS